MHGYELNRMAAKKRSPQFMAIVTFVFLLIALAITGTMDKTDYDALHDGKIKPGTPYSQVKG